MIGARPSDGSSSRSSFGPQHQRPGHGEHLLLAAAQAAGLLPCAARPGGGTPRANGSMSARTAARSRADVGARPRGSPRRSARGTCPGPAARGRCPGARSTRSGARRSSAPVEDAPSPSCRPCRTRPASWSSCRRRSPRAARRPRRRSTTKSRPCRTATGPYAAFRSVTVEHGVAVTRVLPGRPRSRAGRSTPRRACPRRSCGRSSAPRPCRRCP